MLALITELNIMYIKEKHCDDVFNPLMKGLKDSKNNNL